MTTASRYLAGLTIVALAGAALVSVAAPDQRAEVSWGLGIALLAQAPLGWWTLRSIGRPAFQLVWALGMLLRFGVVGITAIVLVPAFRWQIGPVLGTLVGVMLALLVVEAVTAVREHTWGKT